MAFHTPTIASAASGIAARYHGDQNTRAILRYLATTSRATPPRANAQAHGAAIQNPTIWYRPPKQGTLRRGGRRGEDQSIQHGRVRHARTRPLSSEVGHGVIPCLNQVDPGYYVTNSNHNGLRPSATYGAGISRLQLGQGSSFS